MHGIFVNSGSMKHMPCDLYAVKNAQSLHIFLSFFLSVCLLIVSLFVCLIVLHCMYGSFLLLYVPGMFNMHLQFCLHYVHLQAGSHASCLELMCKHY